MKTVAVIPVKSNFESALLPFLKTFVIDRIIDNAQKLKFIDKIVVATESRDIDSYIKKNYKNVEVANIFGCKYPTEMLFQYYIRNQKFDYYFLLPSNDPSINAVELNKMWRITPKQTGEITTFYSTFFCFEDLKRHWSHKMITNSNDYVMYCSRSIIPVNEFGECVSLHHYKNHTGIYIFPKVLLIKEGRSLWGNWISQSENISCLEQNRIVDSGIKLKAHRINHVGFQINSLSQLSILERRINSKGKQSGYCNSSLQQLSEDCN